MSLAVGISTYGNASGLDSALASVAHLADQIFVIHGPYLGFNLQVPDSLFRTQEVVARYSNAQLIDTTLMPLAQNEKRNKYLEEARDYDFLLVLDDDEVVSYCNLPLLRTNMHRVKDKESSPGIYTVWYLQQNGLPNDLSRILYKPGRFKYVQNHFNFSIDGKFVGAQGKRPIDGITLMHKKAEDVGRTKEFEKGMDLYEVFQLFNEVQNPK